MQNWEGFKQDAKDRKDKREQANTEIIMQWCTLNNIMYRFVAQYQIRIDGAIDIFPQSKKYHDIANNERGIISGSIADFLNKKIMKE